MDFEGPKGDFLVQGWGTGWTLLLKEGAGRYRLFLTSLAAVKPLCQACKAWGIPFKTDKNQERVIILEGVKPKRGNIFDFGPDSATLKLLAGHRWEVGYPVSPN